jgi:hypothetical protein
VWSKRPSKCCEDRVASIVVNDVIEDAPAQYGGVSSAGRGKNIRDRKRHTMGPIAGRPLGHLYELRREVHTTDDVAAACKLARVSSRPAAGIEELRSRQNVPADKPGRDPPAFLFDRPVDEQIERPGVFSIERATKDLIHPYESRVTAMMSARSAGTASSNDEARSNGARFGKTTSRER